MKRRALLNLLVRPLTAVLAVLLLPLVTVAILAASSTPQAAVAGVAVVICAAIGIFVGEGIAEAARCPFAWTLPRFRRALLREFVVCGMAASALVALIVAAVSPITATSLLVAVGFTAFTLGGAVHLVPEGALLFPIAVVAVFAAGPSAPASWLNAPLETVTAALAVSALALWSAFSTRAFRWSALTGPRQDGRFIWHEWSTMPWWPRPRTRFWRPASRAPSRARYVGTSVLCTVVSSYRATRPGAWLGALALWALCSLYLVPSNLNTVRLRPLSGLWAILATLAWVIAAWSRRSASRAPLPWSRQQHLTVTYLRDLGGLAGFLTMIATGLVAAAPAVSPEVLGAVGRGIGVMAVFVPAAEWISGPPTGGRRADGGVEAVLGLVLFVAFVVVLNLVIVGLPELVSSGAAQAVVLGLLIVGSQVLNWRRLKGYFANRDLVRGEP
jgi:hypothetical protein